METKKCIRCNLNKSITDFNKSSHHKSGYSNYCKACSRLNTQRYAVKRRDKKAEYMRKYRTTENGKVAIAKTESRPERIEKLKQRLIDKADKIKSQRKEYYLKNKDKLAKYQVGYRENNREKVRERARNYVRNRLHNDPEYKLHRGISRSMNRTLKKGQKNRRKWETLVGYTTKQLKDHLEKLFKPGMTWENHGQYGWQIDHIKPISSFNITSPECEDFKKCWALENLQPLWWKENITKGNKIT